MSPPAIFGLGAIIVAALAQYAHTYLGQNRPAVFLFIIALVYWLVAFLLFPVEVGRWPNAPADPAPRRTHQVRWLFVAGAAALSLITYLTTADNSFNSDNVSAWILSIAIFLYAFWEPQNSIEEWRAIIHGLAERLRSLFGDGIHISGAAAALIVILIIGAFFYFADLDRVPAEMTSDHAELILSVNNVVSNGAAPIYFEGNNNHDPMEFYLVAALVKLADLPLGFETVKALTALMGLLAVPAAYLMTRELFEDVVALAAAALVAISKWPVTIARLGLGFALTPLLVCLIALFFIRALKYRHRNDFLMTGLLLGLAEYASSAFLVATLFVVVALLLWLLLARADGAPRRTLVVNWLALIGLTIIVAMPWLSFSTDHPKAVLESLTGLSSGATVALGVLPSNIVNAALMFNWTSDGSWPDAISGDPALDPISGGLFVLGLAFALYRLVRHREWAYGFTLAGLAVMVIPSVLRITAPQENPSYARAVGTVPFAAVLVALPLVGVGRVLYAKTGRIWAQSFFVLLLALTAVVNDARYFGDYDASYRSYSWNSSEIAQAIKSFASSVGDYDHAYVMIYPHWVDARNVGINMGLVGWQQTIPSLDSVRSREADGANQLFVLSPEDKADLSGLQEIFKNGQMRTYNSETPGKDFVLWYVPGTIPPEDPVGSQ